MVPGSEVVDEAEVEDATTTVAARTNFGAESLWL